MGQFFLNNYIQTTFLMSPFFAISLFAKYSNQLTIKETIKSAIRVGFYIGSFGTVLYFFGIEMFHLFGITLDSFRVGAGILLFLNALSIIRGDELEMEGNKNFLFIPFSIPAVLGPGTMALIILLGNETRGTELYLVGYASFVSAVSTLCISMALSQNIKKIVGENGMLSLSKITGLILISMSAQIILTGLKNIFLITD